MDNTGGEFFAGVKMVEEEHFRKQYIRIIQERNKTKDNPAITVICIFCQGSAVETSEGYVCPKCGPKLFKGINLIDGYFTCKCGLLVDGKTKKCQGCKSYNSPFRTARF